MSNALSVGFVCPECDRIFARRNALGSHMRVHAPREIQSTLVCPECGRECSGQRGLTIHLRLKHDPETNRKVSENSRMMWSDKEFHDRTVEKIAKTNRSDEGRRRISEGTSRGLSRPEVRERLSDSSKANWEDPGYREKMEPCMDRLHHDPEILARRSSSMSERWADPEYKDRVSKAISEGSDNPRTRALKSRNSKAVWEGERGERRRAIQSSPETRDNMSRGVHNYWDNLSDEEYESRRQQLTEQARRSNSRPEVRAKISASMHAYYESLSPEEMEALEASRTPDHFKHGFIENQLGELVYWGSSYERRFCECMLDDPDVVVFRRGGVGIKCHTAQHTYIPDFRVWRTNGTVDLIEIKSNHWIETDPMVPHEIAAAKRYCSENGMTYRLLAEKELDEYENYVKEAANG